MKKVVFLVLFIELLFDVKGKGKQFQYNFQSYGKTWRKFRKLKEQNDSNEPFVHSHIEGFCFKKLKYIFRNINILHSIK